MKRTESKQRSRALPLGTECRKKAGGKSWVGNAGVRRKGEEWWLSRRGTYYGPAVAQG